MVITSASHAEGGRPFQRHKWSLLLSRSLSHTTCLISVPISMFANPNNYVFKHSCLLVSRSYREGKKSKRKEVEVRWATVSDRMQPWLLQYQSFPVYLKFSIFRAMVYSLRDSLFIHTFHLIKIFFLSLMKTEFEAFPGHSLCPFLFRHVTLILHFLLVSRHHFIIVTGLLV